MKRLLHCSYEATGIITKKNGNLPLFLPQKVCVNTKEKTEQKKKGKLSFLLILFTALAMSVLGPHETIPDLLCFLGEANNVLALNLALPFKTFTLRPTCRVHRLKGISFLHPEVSYITEWNWFKQDYQIEIKCDCLWRIQWVIENFFLLKNVLIRQKVWFNFSRLA